MNDQPNPIPTETPSIWRRPWQGPTQTLAWFGLVALAAFVIIFSLLWLLDPGPNVADIAVTALLVALALVAAAAAGWWFVRWLCNWRNVRRLLFSAACLLTLLALAYAVENWRGSRAWRAHKAEWEAKGETFSIARLAPPPVPQEKNFALTPLLKPALDYDHTPQGVVWRDTNALNRLQRTRTDLGKENKDQQELVVGNLEKGTFADLAACQAFYRGNTNYPQPTTTGTPAQDVALALAKFDPEFAELRAALESRPQSRYPIEYDFEPSWGILLPHLAHLKGLTQVACLRATAALESGKSAEAFADLKVGLRLSDSLREEPLLIDHLVRLACLGIDLQTVREGLLRHAWTEAQLTELQTNLAAINLFAEYRLAIRGERALSTTGLDFLRRQGFRSNPLDAIGDGVGPNPGFNPYPSGWFYQNMLVISKACQGHLIAAVDDQARRVFPDLSEQGSQALEQMPATPYTLLARMLLPALGNAPRKSARMQTSVDEACVACALERYRLANGKLPETLTALTPRFLERVPHDVVDGKPLRYRLEPDGGYVVYSVGWNQRDEMGERGWKKEKSGKDRIVDSAQGDWPWQMPADEAKSK